MNHDRAHGDLDYLAHLARDSARFVEVLRQTPPETPVPTCPDWDADDLLWHLCQVQWFWGTITGRQLTTRADVEALGTVRRPSDRVGLLALFAQASRDLHDNLSSTPADTPAWTWSQEQTTGFIRRRQAHEALIHRLDAELTARDRTPMEPDLSTDGVDETLTIMYGAAPTWGRFAPDPAQTVRVQSTDTDRSWQLTLGQLTGSHDAGRAHGKPSLTVAAWDTRGPAAASLRGTAADLDCWLWHRPPEGQIERAGDPVVLEHLDHSIAAGIS